ncbi:hypothetical protein ABES25_09485 [Bacillus gobiensis]|uniref:hypothetical protein n=1 Tax=Bacillus gobiensis TaxID=1441095 RepID=UPI003D1A5965
MIGELLTNPLVIAIIIGIITTAFNAIFKENKKDSNKQAPSPKQPSENRGNSSEASLPEELDNSADLVTIQNQYEKEKEEIQDRLTKTRNDMSPHKRQPAAKADNVARKALQLNKDTVVQGFILGEAFGPPRSKNPHYTMKSRKKN